MKQIWQKFFKYLNIDFGWNLEKRSVIYKRTMSVEQKIKEQKAKLVPVEGRSGIYTYEECELIVDPLTVIRGIVLREKRLMSQRNRSSK